MSARGVAHYSEISFINRVVVRLAERGAFPGGR
jgi:hypothetical protein